MLDCVQESNLNTIKDKEAAIPVPEESVQKETYKPLSNKSINNEVDI